MKKYLITFSGTYEILTAGNLSALSRKINQLFNEQASGIEVKVYDVTNHKSGNNLLNEIANYPLVIKICRG